jgi:NadR type nicotinamide-nucleotide adenylyltransferase
MEKKNKHILRIALIGPESTSKSTLSEELARYYQTVWVPEYARTYLKDLHRKYTLDDILLIAQEQFKQEQELIKTADHFIFADTELIVSKVWCTDVFNTCPDWITANADNYPYDLYLLTYPDLPWEEDPLRENPHRRMYFFDWYERELKKANANYAVIKGIGGERLKNAISAVEKFYTDYQK